MKNKTVITNNKEIYRKLNQLNLSSEVVLRNVKSVQIDKILNNINKSEKILDVEKYNDIIIVKKVKNIILNVYLR